jgi:F420H(2)-dependent quinone reductase
VTPPRPVLRLGWAIHKALFRVSGGHVGTTPPGKRVGTLFLVSTGRKTGTRRRNALFYVEDGPSFVVVASNAGVEAEPSWWLNLQATPEATVELGTRKIPVRARAARADETARLWPRLVAGYGEYARYKTMRHREIPIVILEPR